MIFASFIFSPVSFTGLFNNSCLAAFFTSRRLALAGGLLQAAPCRDGAHHVGPHRRQSSRSTRTSKRLLGLKHECCARNSTLRIRSGAKEPPPPSPRY